MRKLALLALLTAAACNQSTQSVPPPLDRFYFPTGIALRHVPAGCTAGSAGCLTQLLVGSSNFDLQYDLASGGTIIGVDVDATIAAAGAAPAEPLTPAISGAARVGSFSGELAVVDEETCPGWEKDAQGNPTGRAPAALVASRAQESLYRVDLSGPSAFTCGDGCSQALDATSADAYGVTVACGIFPQVDAAGQPVPTLPPTFQASAFVTYLRTPSGEGRLTQIDLLGVQSPRLIDLGVSPSASSVYDRVNTRLYVTSRFQTVALAPLRWIELAAPGLGTRSIDMGLLVRGLEMRQMALSSSAPRRGYLAMRLYDEDLATTIGARPPTDLSGALAVLDLSDQPSGLPSLSIVNTVAVGRGSNEVRAFPPRANPADPTGAPLRDLVAVSSTDDDTVSLYDDATGTVSEVFDVIDVCPDAGGAPGPCAVGKPQLGKQPFGLAIEPFQRSDIQQKGALVPLARLYVGSFDRGWVNVIEIDPAHPAARSVAVTDAAGNPVLDAFGNPQRALRWDRIGAERP